MAELTARLPEEPAAAGRGALLWGHARLELLHLIWALMEVAILTPVALMLMPWARYWPVPLVTLWVLLLMLLPFNLVRFMGALGLRRTRQRNIMVLLLLGIILLSWRMLIFAPRPLLDLSWLGEFFVSIGEGGEAVWLRTIAVFFVVLVAWWRGLRLVRIRPGIDTVGFRLRAAALIYLFLGLLINVARAYWQLWPFVLLYYVMGLTAVALLRAEQVERESSGHAAGVRPRWLLTVFLTALLVVGTAGLVALLLNGETAGILATWLSPLWKALAALFAVVLTVLAYLGRPLLWLLALVIDFLGALAQRIGQGFGNLLEQAGVDLPGLDQLPTPSPEELVELAAPPQINTRLIGILLMIAAVLIVVLALTRLYREASLLARESEFVTAAGGGQVQRPGFGRRLLNRLGLLRNWRAAASIRRIYVQMCNAAAGAGYPRGGSQTPYEYLATLAEVWPQNPGDSALITQAYVRVRYGEVPETEAELEEIKAAWKRLEALDPARPGATD